MNYYKLGYKAIPETIITQGEDDKGPFFEATSRIYHRGEGAEELQRNKIRGESRNEVKAGAKLWVEAEMQQYTPPKDDV